MFFDALPVIMNDSFLTHGITFAKPLFLFIPMGIVVHQSSFFFSGAFFSNAALS
jgi:hypothetical protein